MRDEPEEKVACESVGLVAQILKQWSENNLSLPQKIGHHLSQLVRYLAGRFIYLFFNFKAFFCRLP